MNVNPLLDDHRPVTLEDRARQQRRENPRVLSPAQSSAGSSAMRRAPEPLPPSRHRWTPRQAFPCLCVIRCLPRPRGSAGRAP